MLALRFILRLALGALRSALFLLCNLDLLQRGLKLCVIIQRLLNLRQPRFDLGNLAVDLLKAEESERRAHILIIYENATLSLME